MSTGPLLRLPLPSKIITIMRCLDLWFLSPLGRHDTGLKFASVFRRMPVQHTMASKRQRWSHSMTKHGQVNAVFSWYLLNMFMRCIFLYVHMYLHWGEMRCGNWPMVHGALMARRKVLTLWLLCFVLFDKWSFNNLYIATIGTSAQSLKCFFLRQDCAH